MLKNGIKLYCESNADTEELPRVYISNGTYLIDKNDEENRQYKLGSFIPHKPWRVISKQEEEIVWGNRNEIELNTYSSISVVRIPEEILMPFQEVRNALVSKQPLSYIQDILRQEKYNISKEIIREYLKKYGNPYQQVFIGINPSNLQTVTYDSRDSEKRFIGLHLDNWHNKSIIDRHMSPNRICINLGTQDRYFLYINLPVKTVFEILKKINSKDSRMSQVSSALGLAFMEQFREYPVLKLRVSPNEAYIAPTENVFHDGSTMGSDCFDITLQVHGEFYRIF